MGAQLKPQYLEHLSFQAEQDFLSQNVDQLHPDTNISVVIPITGHELVNGNFLANLISLAKQDLWQQTEVIYAVNNLSQDISNNTKKYQLNMTLLDVLQSIRAGDYETAYGYMPFSSDPKGFSIFTQAVSRLKIGFIDLANQPFRGDVKEHYIDRARNMAKQLVARRYKHAGRDGTYIHIDTDTIVDRNAFSLINSALDSTGGTVKILWECFPGEGGVEIWEHQAAYRFNKILSNLNSQVATQRLGGWYAQQISNIPIEDNISHYTAAMSDTMGVGQENCMVLANIYRTAYRYRAYDIGGLFGTLTLSPNSVDHLVDNKTRKYTYPRWVPNSKPTGEEPLSMVNNTIGYLKRWLNTSEVAFLNTAVKRRQKTEQYLHELRRSQALATLEYAHKNVPQVNPDTQNWHIQAQLLANPWVYKLVQDYERIDDILDSAQARFPEVFSDFPATYYGLPTANLLGLTDFLNAARINPDKLPSVNDLFGWGTYSGAAGVS